MKRVDALDRAELGDVALSCAGQRLDLEQLAAP